VVNTLGVWILQSVGWNRQEGGRYSKTQQSSNRDAEIGVVHAGQFTSLPGIIVFRNSAHQCRFAARAG
jgi:hypothetical protein